ncbi:helix-turn-helix domain-containing protein [Bradyrhizobium erythrophlei]|uniref:helix-turn-helix domain-containing protein n=1 Tax=Bradyrhizobium erythrophlei TaxID=1437360 RepID=UPI00155FF0EA
MKSTYSYAKDEEIYGEGKAATFCYQVINGAVRISRKLTNGRRQIGAFYFPGDIFGLEPWFQYRWSAEAIAEATTLRPVRRKALLRKAQSNLSFARNVWSITERDLRHADDHRILLGQLTATERLAAFFLQINDRIGVGGQIELPMSRTDIADYLGLTIETVSREITKLSDGRILSRPDGHLRWNSGITLLRPESLRAALPRSFAFDLSATSEDVMGLTILHPCNSARSAFRETDIVAKVGCWPSPPQPVPIRPPHHADPEERRCRMRPRPEHSRA